MAEQSNNAYSILGIPKSTSEKDIKQAYVNLVKRFDPEKHTDRFMVIQKAYDRLKTPKGRAKEDVYTYNVVSGEYLFQPDERHEGENEPTFEELDAARKEYKANALNELIKSQFLRVLFRNAHYNLRRKQLNLAIDYWAEALDVDPAHIRARHNLELACAGLGYSYALHGLHEEAIELWERALQMNPDNTDLLQNLALAAEKANQPYKAGRYWAETVGRWRQKLDKDNDNEYLRAAVVEALNHHGEYVESHEAEIAAEEKKRARPAAPQPQLNRPRPAVGAPGSAPAPAPAQAPVTSRPAAAPSAAAGQTAVNPPTAAPGAAPSAHAPAPPPAQPAPAGGAAPNPTSQTSVPRASSIVSKVVAQANPEPPPTPVRNFTGVDRFREILKLNPEDFDAHFQLCNKLMEEQLYEEAKNELMNLARKHPKNVEVLNMLGWALLNTNQKDMAFNAWKKSLSIDPNNAETREQLVKAHLAMGKAFRNKGLFTQSLVHFKQLTQLMPESAELHMEIAATYDMKGDVRSAALEYNKVLTIDPKHKVARKALNDLRLKR